MDDDIIMMKHFAYEHGYNLEFFIDIFLINASSMEFHHGGLPMRGGRTTVTGGVLRTRSMKLDHQKRRRNVLLNTN